MDAAEADDPEGAQLCWQSTVKTGTPSTAKGFFDVFKDSGEKDSAKAIPSTVQVHDMAADDLCADSPPPVDQHMQYAPCATTVDDSGTSHGGKKVQDDITTPGQHTADHQRKPWADVELDDTDFAFHSVDNGQDEHEPLAGSLTQPGVSDAIAELANLNGQEYCDSQELRTQCGPSVTTSQVLDTGAGLVRQQHAGRVGEHLPEHHLSPVVEFVLGGGTINNAPMHGVGSDELCALGYSDTLGYDCSFGPQSDIQRALHNALTQAGGERSLPVDRPADSGACVGGSVTMQHVDFMTYARDILPDVYPASGDESSISDGAHTDADVESTRSHDDESVGSLRTQFGPCHLTLAQYAPQVPVRDVDLNAEVLAPRMQTLRTQCGPLPQQHFQTPGTLAQHAPQEQEKGSLQTLQTQCGPLPQQHLLSPCTQTLAQYAPQDLVQQAHCAQADPLPLVALADTLAQLVAAASSTTSTRDDRLSSLQAYAAATDAARVQLELWEQAQHPPLTSGTSGTQCGPVPQLHLQSPWPQTLAQHAPQDHVCDVAMQTLRTQRGPLPQQSMQTPFNELSAFGPSPIQAAKEMKVCEQAQHTPLASGTQCGPVPQQRIQTPCPQNLAQYAPQELRILRSTHRSTHRRSSESCAVRMPTPRTQCGPLPQQSMQTPFKDPSAFGPSQIPAAKEMKVRRGQRNGKSKGKGKGKGKAVVADDATRSSLKGYG